MSETIAMSFRARLAAATVRRTAALSRRLGTGSGSVIGGRLGLLVDPRLLAHVGAGREIALVSGTNGKTTTSAMLAAALGARGAVASSSEGANMTAGLVSALCEAPEARLGALEVDESYLTQAVNELHPRLVVLLNLSRDQLDRVGEVRMVAQRWHDALAGTSARIVANADDPLVVYAARDAANICWVGAGGLWHADAEHCPICGARIVFSPARDDPGPVRWSCSCGFARPTTALEVRDDGIELGGEVLIASTNLPGRFNLGNAALALAGARELGVEAHDALARIAALTEVSGRFLEVVAGRARARLLLAKNPAGWTEMLELVHSGTGPLVVAINAREQDGRDPSWLWDVAFERLEHRLVVATGERRRDLAVRLRHAGVEHLVVADAFDAVRATGVGAIDFVANYSAFQELRHRARQPQRATAPSPIAPSRVDEHPRRTPVSARPSTSGTRPLKVVLVYPDLLGTYGDGGNARILVNRARWRDRPAELVIATSDEPLPTDGDLYVLGGAEDSAQIRAAAELRAGVLGEAVGRGAVVLGVCAGFQLLGRNFPAGDGYVAGAGLLELETVRVSLPRAVGELSTEAAGALGGLGTFTGFENHAGRTRLDVGVAPLGRVRFGVGNEESSAVDGAVDGRVFGTYLHGPVLARNPALADHLLELALNDVLLPIDDCEELALRAERLAQRSTARTWRRFRPTVAR